MKKGLREFFILVSLTLLCRVAVGQQWINYNSYNTANGLSHNTVYDIAIDNAGNKWFACYYGLSKFNGTSWTRYTTTNTPAGLAGNKVYCAALDSEGNLWFGTDGGVSKLSGSTWTKFTTADGLVNNEVHAIAFDASGNAWFGTDAGVSKFNGSQWTSYRAADGLISNSVQSLAAESSGAIWIGCYGGASRFDGTTFMNYTQAVGGLAGFSVNKIAIDATGNKLFATESGVSVLSGSSWNTLTAADGLPGNDVREITIAPGGKIWFGTTDGAAMLNGSVWTRYTTDEGLFSNYVNAIAADAGGVTWFGCEVNGVSKLSVPSVAVSPADVSIGPAEGSVAYFSVISNGNWTLTDNQPWLTASTTSAKGNATITLSAAANYSTAERTAVVTVTMTGLDPVSLTVTQQAMPPTLNVMPAEISLPAAAGSYAFVAVETNVNWSAASSQAWCTVTPASGNGTLIITASAQANVSAAQRAATITFTGPGVGPREVIVYQEASGAPALSVSPSSISLASGAASSSFAVNSTVAWTAVSSQGWLSVGTASGAGNANVTVTATENTGSTERSATVTVSGAGVTSQVITVTQNRSPYINVSVSDLDIDPAHNAYFATANFGIVSNSHWEISWSGTWFNLSHNQGDGNAAVTVTAEPNSESSARSGSIFFRLGNSSTPVVHTITLTQGAGPYLTVTPPVLEIAGAAGSQGTFTINTNTSWSLAFAFGGMTADKMSGTGNAAVTITAPENNTGSLRKEFAAIMTATTSGLTKELEISQSSLGALLDVSPASISIGSADASTATFSIVSNREWVVSTNVSWLETNVTSGSGNATITVIADANPFDVPNQAIITVAGDGGTILRTIPVTQDAAVIILEVSATSFNLPGDENSQATFTVSSNVDWGISSDSFWLTVNPSGSTGTRTVTLTATGNYSGDTRTGKLTIWSSATSKNRYINVVQSVITSVDDPDAEALSVYPNPVTGILHVGTDQEEVSVTVSDLRGRKIFTTTLTGTDKTLDVSRLARGVYLLSMDLNGKPRIARFVKQ